MGTVLALGLLVIICGFIAYSGDLLGRRLGKRRLTLWGLRPRHTAVVCTVITGMVIAALSLSLMVLLSAGVRQAILEGEALLQQNYVLWQDNSSQMAISNRLRSRNNEQTLRIDEQRKRIDAQKQEIQGLQASSRGLRERNQALTSDLKQREQRNLRLERERERLERERERLEARIQAHAREYGELVARNAKLQGRNDRLQADTRESQALLVRAEQDVKRAREAYLLLQRQASSQIDDLALRAQRLGDEPLIARAGEELARSVVTPAPGGEATVRAAMEGLIRRAGQVIAQRGRPAPGRPALRPVVLLPREQPQTETFRQYGSLVDILNQKLPDYSRAPRHGFVVRLIADKNVTPGSSVPVRLSLPVPRRLAFRKGEGIATVDVNGQQSEGELLRTLLAFLHGTVRERALKRRLLPAADGSVGELQYDPLLEAVSKVRQIGGPARVGGVAAADIWSEGPLRIDFYVLPGDPRVADDP